MKPNGTAFFRRARQRGALLALLVAPLLHACSGGGASSSPALPATTSEAPGSLTGPLGAASAAPALTQSAQLPENPASSTTLVTPPTTQSATATTETSTNAIETTTTATTASTGVTLLSDTFNDGTARGWTPYSGKWSLCKRGNSSYEYCATATSENATFAGDRAWTNYTASAYVFMNAFPHGRSGMDLVVRAQDPNHWDQLELVNEYDGSQQWEFWRNDGGAWNNLSRGYVPFRAGEHDIVRVAVSGTRLTASLSRDLGATFTTLGSATDTRFTSGGIGLRAWGGLTGTFDSITVTGGGVSPTPGPTAAPTSPPATTSLATTFPRSPLRRKLSSLQRDSRDGSWRAAQAGSFRNLEFGYGPTVRWNDYTTPVYNVSTSDIPHVVHCSSYACPGEEGATVYLPRGAKPEGGSDGHVAIVNRGQNREDDMWLVHSISDVRGSRIDAGHAGSCKLDGDGTRCGATASNLPLTLGMVRASEVENGTISSALQIGLNCASWTFIYPANASDGNNSSCPPLGTHGYVDYSDAQINATNNPTWAKNFWKALDREHYGFFASDTGGGAGLTIAQVESDNSYTVVGRPGPWFSFYNALVSAREPNIGVYGGIAHIELPQAGLDIAGHTHFLRAGL